MRGGAGDGSSMVTVPTSASLNVSIFLEESIDKRARATCHGVSMRRYYAFAQPNYPLSTLCRRLLSNESGEPAIGILRTVAVRGSRGSPSIVRSIKHLACSINKALPKL